MGVAGRHKSILEHQALVIVGTVVYEGLLVAERPGNAPDFITSCQVIETRLYLEKKKNNNQRDNLLFDLHLSISPISQDSTTETGPHWFHYLHIRAVIEQVQEGR